MGLGSVLYPQQIGQRRAPKADGRLVELQCLGGPAA